MLWVRLDAGDPPNGVVGMQGDDRQVTFFGWIDFMAAINSLRIVPPVASDEPLAGRDD